MPQKSLFFPDIKWSDKYHVLSVTLENYIPVLSCVMEGSDSKEEITVFELNRGDKLELKASSEKRCIGKWKNGIHIPCPDNAKVRRFDRCDLCAEERLPDQNCIFQPKCHGNSCEVPGHYGEKVEFCSRPHMVYLAFFGNNPKVGMTSTLRGSDRLKEQGADAFAVIEKPDSRLDARNLEKLISKELGIRQSYSSSEKARFSVKKINYNEIKKKFKEISEEIMSISKSEPEKLVLLKNYPIEFPLRSLARERTIPGIHMGKIIGIKGKSLYYDSGGLNLLKTSDLISRKIQFPES